MVDPIVKIDENDNFTFEQAALLAQQDESHKPDLINQSTGLPEVKRTYQEYETDAKDLLDLLFDSALFPLDPRLMPIFTDEQREKMLTPIARLMERYKMAAPEILTNPFLSLFLVMTPTFRPLYDLYGPKKLAAAITEKPEPMRPIVDVSDPSSLHNRV